MSEKAILITLDLNTARRPPTGRAGATRAEDATAELEELARSAGLVPVETCVFRQKEPNSALLFGRGKAESLRDSAVKLGADVVVFHNDLSSTQQRNLEELIGVKTIDRTQLILDIFAQRARSTEGKLQVELAQLKYLLPRLSGKGVLLSRLGGGVGTRGPGEQKLEVDRRRIRDKIVRLARQLADLKSRRQTGIRKKKEREFPLVALVGYTNAGKSSLFNALTSASVLVKNQLFSTLDTTTRALELPGNLKALLADTVGFVRDLPHHLVESFQATLEEAVQADTLLHVIDASRPDRRELEKAVEEVLDSLGAERKKIVRVFNKSDLVPIAERADGGPAVWISAKTGEGLDDLRRLLAEGLPPERSLKNFFVPPAKLGVVYFLYREGEIVSREDRPEGAWITAFVSAKNEALFRRMLEDGRA